MKKTIGLFTFLVAGLGLALTPQMAAADEVFAVDESVVDDTAAACLLVDCTFDADLINGGYTERLTINPDFTFDVSAFASFTQYKLGGFNAGTGLAAATEGLNVGGYDLYALFQASGTVNPATGVITFFPAGAQVDLYIDADQNNTFTAPATGAGAWTVVDTTGDDELVLSSTTLSAGTGAIVPPVGGFFDLEFRNLILTAFGNTYFPDLASLGLVFATVDGDFNTIPSPPAPGTYDERGDLSIVYQVPEPATMTLFGLGLLASGYAARRRRQFEAI